jgi:hypothetical protein
LNSTLLPACLPVLALALAQERAAAGEAELAAVGRRAGADGEALVLASRCEAAESMILQLNRTVGEQEGECAPGRHIAWRHVMKWVSLAWYPSRHTSAPAINAWCLPAS